MTTESVAAHQQVGRRLVLADLVPGAWVRDAALVVAGAGLTGLAAQISITVPTISPVPFTGQTFAVVLVGAALGPWRALASMMIYLVAGVAGVPWYAHAEHGFGGPSFGYIIGFVLAALVVGELARRGADRRLLSTAGLMFVGNVIIYAVGVPWLMADLDLTLATGIALGVVPFLLGDIIKTALAAGLLPGAWALVNRWRGDHSG